jgi:peptidoglycan/LPS O-acetylase OafA/YrhL
VVAFHAVSVFQAGVVGLENYPEVVEWDQTWTARYILSGLLAVDTFFFISGFLLAFSYLKSAPDQSPVAQLIKVPKMYLHRYLRLTPSVGVMYLVTITIFRFLGSGPTWSLIANFMKDACKKKWWEFFLYVQNYTDPDNMCVNPMWYLSADMQMFILAPLVLIPTSLFIRKHFKATIWALMGLTVLSVVIPMLIRYFVDEAAGNIYTAHERFNNFLIGITFGAFMRMKKHKPSIFSSWANFALWVVVIVVSLFFNIYWHDVLNNYDLLKYTLFMGFYRPVWCSCLVFMVYSCYHNQGGLIQWFLTRPAFQILGRMSYSMYVLHFLVEIYAGGTLKTNVYFSNYFLFYNWCGHIIVTMIIAFFWVLAFEFPMLTIDKYLLGDDKKTGTWCFKRTKDCSE